MALVKPIAQSKNAFDATRAETFYFIANGGDQVVKNTLVITDQQTFSVVYQNTVESYQLQQTVPENKLDNDRYYNYYFITYNINGEESEMSNRMPFYCFSQPYFVFKNMPYDNIIKTSNYQFQFQYSQIENQMELLDFAIIKIYDGANKLISTSDKIMGSSDLSNIYTYQVDGLEDNSVYKIEIIGTTVNGMDVTTGLIEFYVQYELPYLPSALSLYNNCKNGYVTIQSNFIVLEGESYPSAPKYIDNEKLELLKITYDYPYVKWTSDKILKNGLTEGYTLQLWGTFTRLGTILKVNSNLGSYVLSFERGIKEGQTEAYDYCVLNTVSGGRLVPILYSNGVDFMNNTSDYTIWLRWIPRRVVDNRVNEGHWELKLEVLNQNSTIFEWNNIISNNIEYFKHNELMWNNEYENLPSEQTYGGSSIRLSPPYTITLENGIFNHLHISSNITREYNPIPSDVWELNTLFDCNFNNNISGGNVETALDNIDALKIKRREKGTFDWITIKTIPVSTPQDLQFFLEDYLVPHDTIQEYAIVSMLNNVEGGYVINEVHTYFDGVFISTKDKIFKLYEGITYGEITNVKPVNVMQTINSKYPIVIQNSEIRYKNISISGILHGYNFENNRKIDRKDIKKQTDDFVDLLNSKQPICVKDWLGDIYIGRPSGDDSINRDVNNGFSRVTFSMVEQGQYDNEADLLRCGLI